MSANAAVLGTVDFLRDPAVGLALGAAVCDEQPDGQPPPWDGELYYAVHEPDDGGWSNDADEYLNEYFGVAITITLRAGYAPPDRHAVELKRDLRTRAAALRAKIHSSYDHMAKVNARLGAADQVFVEPIRFRSVSKVQVRGPDWFWAEADGDGDAPTGLSLTVTFGRMRRVQGLDGPMT